MKLEWDEKKRLINNSKHGLEFQDAWVVFEDEYALFYEDKRKNYGEKRMIIVATLSSKILATLCYTLRKECVRIISFRIASKREKRMYHDNKKI